MLRDDLKSVAVSLLSEFGNNGFLIHDDAVVDEVSGIETGTATETAIKYHMEQYKASELVENRILAGDAYIIFTLDNEPSKNWKLKDAIGAEWNIIDIQSFLLQDGVAAYQAHVRK